MNHPHSFSVARITSLLRVLVADSPFHGRPLRDMVDPFQQMGEGLHVFLAEPAELPALDPRPGADIGDGVFALAVPGQVLARLASVLAAQLDFEHAVDAESFVAETFNGICDSTSPRSICHHSPIMRQRGQERAANDRG